jgi:CheY-like chemotaxis protein
MNSPRRLGTAGPIRGKRVLVVDDEPWVSEILLEMLARDGHQVEVAVNGAEALDRIRQASYDLILCDLRMPELDGPALYGELEAGHPEMLSRIVFVTGSGEDPKARDFLGRSGAPFLLKPFTLDGIHEMTQRALRRAEAEPV